MAVPAGGGAAAHFRATIISDGREWVDADPAHVELCQRLRAAVSAANEAYLLRQISLQPQV